DVLAGQPRGGEEEDVVARFGGIDEGRFFGRGAGGDQRDAAARGGAVGGGRGGAGVARRLAWALGELELVDVEGAVGVLGNERVGGVEEEGAGVREIAGLGEGWGEVDPGPARDVGGEGLTFPEVGPVDEEVGFGSLVE